MCLFPKREHSFIVQSAVLPSRHGFRRSCRQPCLGGSGAVFEGVQKTYEKRVGFVQPLGVEKVSEHGAKLRLKSEKKVVLKAMLFFFVFVLLFVVLEPSKP